MNPRIARQRTPGRWLPPSSARYDGTMRFEGKFGFQAVYAACSPELLHEFEASLALHRLPADYRDFLLQWNGGRFDPSLKIVFPLQDQEGEDDFGRVFHFLACSTQHTTLTCGWQATAMGSDRPCRGTILRLEMTTTGIKFASLQAEAMRAAFTGGRRVNPGQTSQRRPETFFDPWQRALVSFGLRC